MGALVEPGDEIFELDTFPITGSGSFLVDRGTGRPAVFSNDPDGDGDDDTDVFTLSTDRAEAWFEFTTLGDGRPGDYIEITPGARETFFDPIAAGNVDQVSVPKPGILGSASLIQGDDLDDVSGGGSGLAHWHGFTFRRARQALSHSAA